MGLTSIYGNNGFLQKRICIFIKIFWQYIVLWIVCIIQYIVFIIHHFLYMDKKSFSININDIDIQWGKNQILFEEVVHIAFPQLNEKDYILYVVTYFDWPKWKESWSLTAKKKIHVQNWMCFTCATPSLS